MSAPIVIAGAGLAGLRTAEELRRAGYEGELVLLGDEPRAPYDRPPLSKQFVRGETTATPLRPDEFYDEKQIDLRLGTAATGVDTDAKQVQLADGSTIAYEHLVVATGLRPRLLPGADEVTGVHVLRSHDDAVAIREGLRDTTAALVIGAGFIGCELAASLRAQNVPVVLVEPQPAPLAGVLGAELGELVARWHRAEGVDLRCGVGVAGLLADPAGRVRGARLADGSEVTADLVVSGIGSRPVTDWLAGSGIELAEPTAGGGVFADEAGRTSVPGVWAVGDVAAWRTPTGEHRRIEHWTNAGEQAKLLTCALLGLAAPGIPQVPYFWSDQYDLKLQALGTPRATDDIRILADDGRKFLAYYFREARLSGVVGAGMTGQVMKMRAKIAAAAPVEELLGATQ
ncbi:FAD-dependent oxidoreductase [Nocardia zapadnayensis]|uniref:NAD(P)/FAD-dependent oxidoreductase n=1 Tax=Nocardia rhamnosiphila TaxID=426716 RepID=UPI0022460A13|nr:FAD-dependent oxidoreductase [Nocardia zapadnayensis]MCX0270888.1 FAD-dependent oxidoreductase [Nocardia zapadnayensis]